MHAIWMVYILKKEMNSSRVLWVAFEIIIIWSGCTLRKVNLSEVLWIVKDSQIPKRVLLKTLSDRKSSAVRFKRRTLRLLDLTFFLKAWAVYSDECVTPEH